MKLLVVFVESNLNKTDENKSEDMEQAEFVQWMRRTHPEHRIYAVPNGGLRSKRTAMMLKITGTVPGIPDLAVPSLFMYIEMKKAKGGRVSPEQKDWLEYLRSVGYHAEVCNGKEEAIKFVEKVLALLKK
jgi:hypothetical protein